MKPDEEFCKEVFSQYLERLGVNYVKWDEVPKPQEPPDYFLQIGEQKFAVEVTGLMEMVDIRGRLDSTVGLNAALFCLYERLERQAKKAGIVKGAHVLTLEPVANLKAREQEIRERVFDYMRGTQGMKRAPRNILAQDGDNRIVIEKLGDHKDYLAPVISRGIGASESEIRLTVSRMFREAVEKKRWKLREIELPKILLLLDRYHCADRGEWIEAARETSLEGFCLVVRIWADETAMVLYSDEGEWAW